MKRFTDLQRHYLLIILPDCPYLTPPPLHPPTPQLRKRVGVATRSQTYFKPKCLVPPVEQDFTELNYKVHFEGHKKATGEPRNGYHCL
jgi:hypothetical protein